MAKTESAEPAQPVRVLVVDDEFSIRRLFRTALSSAGCSVETVGNAREALQVLMQQSFDVMVVDLKMEGMNGLVFLQEALKIWPWMGVVIVSGYVDEQSLPRAHELGVTRVIEKPAEIQVLCQNVLDEAREKKTEFGDVPKNSALALMRDHLRLLGGIDQSVIGSDTLVKALLDFGRSLSQMISADAVGILVLDKQSGQRDLLFHVPSGVAPEFLAEMKQEMFKRYEALSAEFPAASSIKTQIDGAEASDSGPDRLGSVLTVPLMMGKEFCGVLTLASASDNAYTPADISLLYHAANHVSAVFMSLRRMHLLATRDPLTGAFNRIRLEEELERTWLLTRRYETSMAVVVADIDNFKTMNDSYGHAIGDEILRDLASLMLDVARATDLIARYGGDEFVAVLPQATEANARTFGERFITRLREHVFCPNTHKLTLTCSVGIATSTNSSAPATSEELLSQADRALFMAKRAGRNRLCIWPEQTFGAVDIGESADDSAPDVDGAPTAEVEPAGGKRDHILVVDDESTILELVGTMLERRGYDVSCFSSADDAISAVSASPGKYDVLLTDLSMPDKSGLDLLREISSADESVVKIVMTGYATVDAAVDCLRQGAYDFIQKPVRSAQLAALLSRALEYRYLKIDNARYQAHLEEMVRKRSAQLAASLEEVKRSYHFTLEALVAMLDARENQTGQHSFRTRDLTVMLARKLGVRGEELDAIASGSFLHDIGKIGIPDAILLKPGPLLPQEWEIMKTHSEIDYNILRSSPYLRIAAELVLSHHERWDGRGYPRKLGGEQICIGARIFSVTDAYDTMRSPRVYRDPVTPKEAVEEILRNKGAQFDPTVVDAFMACHEEMEAILHP